MADDHLNVAVASDGTLYAAVKTSYDTAGYPKMALLVRRPAGTWDDLYPVDEAGTRPIVLLNEPASELLYVYTSSEGYNNTVYKTSSTSTINLTGARQTLITGGVNDTTSTKQNYTNDIVILASSANSRPRACTAPLPRPSTTPPSRSTTATRRPRTRPRSSRPRASSATTPTPTATR